MPISLHTPYKKDNNMLNTYSRRNFLKLSAGIVASGTALSSSPKAHAMGQKISKSTEPAKLVKGYCPFCQVRCTYHAEVRNGKIERIIGDKDNRWTGGSMCPKGLSIAELMESPHRLVHPMKKEADGSWTKISYDEAVKLTAQKMRACLDTHKDAAGDRIAMTMPLWDSRESELAALITLNMAGSVHAMPPGETCVSTAANMLTMMAGTGNPTTTVNEILNSKLLILWGANLCELYPAYSRWLVMAKEKNVQIVYIDPRSTSTSNFVDFQVHPIPGTDGVLAMGIINYLVQNELLDEEKARELVPELDVLKEDVQSYSLEQVEAITGVPQDQVIKLAEIIGKSDRTIVWFGGSICRYTNGIPTVRTVILMQGITGNMIGEGRGILTMHSGKPGGEHEFVEAMSGKNTRAKMNFRRLRLAMSKKKLDILFLNSSYRRYPDGKGVREAIGNVPFVVHCGFYMTPEAEISHLFVPMTFSPEAAGSAYGNEKETVWRDQIVEAPGECVTAMKFYSDVGREVFGDKYPYFNTPEEMYNKFCEVVPSWKGLTLERVRKSPDGLVWPIYEENGEERLGCVFTEGKLLTPDGFMKVNDKVFGRIKWTAPKDSPYAPKANQDFPLIFTQGKVVHHWQHTVTNYSPSLAQFSQGRTVSVHPDTAKKYELADGDKVYLETPVGKTEAKLIVSEAILPGTVFTPSHLCPSAPFEQNKGIAVNDIVPNNWDRISCQHNGVGCRLTKI